MNKICYLFSYAWYAVECPLRMIIATWQLYLLLGNAIFAGVACLLIGVPVVSLLGYKARQVRTKSSEIRDKRIKIMHEILSGIKVRKME